MKKEIENEIEKITVNQNKRLISGDLLNWRIDILQFTNGLQVTIVDYISR